MAGIDDDWDLNAVVRSCNTTTSLKFPASSSQRDDRDRDRDDNQSQFSGDIKDNELEQSSPHFQGLEEIYKELLHSEIFHSPSKPPHCNSHVVPQRQQLLQTTQQITIAAPPELVMFQPQKTDAPQPIRPRRRKNHQTKVIQQMTQEELSGDSWAWRKYGQKPIKGSPYPRNYYRCSTLKGCTARKQVERCQNDPDIFVVSYSGEHTHPRPTHRSSLAGSTRTKFSSSSTSTAAPTRINSPPPASAAMRESEAEENYSDGAAANIEEDGEDDDDDEHILIPNSFMTTDDDGLSLFPGFHDLSGGGGGGGTSESSGADKSSSCNLLSPPWTPTSSTTNSFAAGGGGS